MYDLHRNNVSESAATVQLSIKCDHEENIAMINNKHDQEMRKIEIDGEIKKNKAISQNRIEEEKNRTDNEAKLLKTKGDIEKEMLKTKGEIDYKLGQLDYQKLIESNKHTQEMKKLSDTYENNKFKLNMQSKAQDQAHELAMDKQNKQQMLDIKEADRKVQNDNYQFKKDMEEIGIHRTEVENKHLQKMTELNQNHEQQMKKI